MTWVIAKVQKNEKPKKTLKEELIHEYHVVSENVMDQVKTVAEGVITLNEKVERYHEESRAENEMTRRILSQAITGVDQKLSQAITSVREELSQAITNVDQKLDKTREELKSEIQGVDQKVDKTREELKSEIQEVRQELKSDIQGVDQKLDKTREELKSEIQGVDQKVDRTREELKSEIQSTRQELKTQIQESRQEVLAATKFSYAELDRRLTTLEKEFIDLRVRFEKIENRSTP